MRYLKLKISKKEDADRIMLDDYVQASKEKLDCLKAIVPNITYIKQNVYDVSNYMAHNFKGTTIQSVVPFDDVNVQVTYHKSNQDHQILIPKASITKKEVYSISLPSNKIHGYVSFDSSELILTSKSKGKHGLSENEIMIRES